MQIWVGEDMMLPFGMAVLFMMYFYVLKMGDIRGLFVDAAGLWWEQRWRAIAETLANLVLNIALGWYFGVWGIVAATLISLFCINFCWGSRIVFDCYSRTARPENITAIMPSISSSCLWSSAYVTCSVRSLS